MPRSILKKSQPGLGLEFRDPALQLLLPISDSQRLGGSCAATCIFEIAHKKTLTFAPFFRCVVFGSVNERRDSAGSDIDLAIIFSKEVRKPPPRLQKELEKLAEVCREKFGKRLSIIYLSEKELAENRNKELYRNILKGLEIKK